MYKVVLLVSLLFIQCNKKVIPKVSENTSVDKVDLQYSCRMPFNVGLDSLYKFMLSEYEQKRGDRLNSKTTESFLKISHKGKFDNSLMECQKYLMKKLGNEMYCKYLYLIPSSFGFTDESNLIVRYILLLPKIKVNKKYPLFSDALQDVMLEFKFKQLANGSVEILYPKSVPDCNGLPDCGITITKKMAIDTCYKIGFLSDNVQALENYSDKGKIPIGTDYYSIQTDGTDWIIIKTIVTKAKEYQVKINLKNGGQSKIIMTRRID